MGRVVNVRVQLRKKHNNPERNFKDMLHEFKRKVDKSGVPQKLKENQFFESKSQKKRRKKNAAKSKRRQESLKELILAGERVKAPSGFVKKVLKRR